MEKISSPFINIDRIFIISLKTSTDRQKLIKERFPEMIHLDIFEWYLVDRDSENPERGCFNSHQNIVKIAKEKGYKQIIIFEDDAFPLTSWKEFVNNVNNITYPDNWKYVMLGLAPLNIKKTANKNLYKVLCAGSCVSYIVNVERSIIYEYNNNNNSLGIDSVLFCNSIQYYDLYNIYNIYDSNNYAIYPVLIRQKANKSTIGKNHDIIGTLEYDRDILLKTCAVFNVYEWIIIIIFVILAIGLLLGLIINKNINGLF